jgi:hypothetical protein
MKIYLFLCDSYDEYWDVMSDSPENALKALKKHLAGTIKEKTHTRNDGTTYTSYEYERYQDWKNATVDKLKDGYTLKVYDINKVIDHEYS